VRCVFHPAVTFGSEKPVRCTSLNLCFNTDSVQTSGAVVSMHSLQQTGPLEGLVLAANRPPLAVSSSAMYLNVNALGWYQLSVVSFHEKG